MSASDSVIAELSRWGAAVRFADIPSKVRAVARRCVIDTLAVVLAGSGTEVASRARAIARLCGAKGDARLFGQSECLSAPGAAFVNATAGHALDFDDNCYAGFVHGSVVILPAALAVAQMEDLNGERLLTAFVVGAECEYALAKALTREIYDRGWWTSGVLGSVGACAAACHALGLDADRTAAALGIALAGTGGMKAAFGSDAKTLMAGRTSEAGVIAALLAREGCSGPLAAVEDVKGLAALFNGGVLNRHAMPVLGEQWSLLSPGVDFKRIPVCLSSHAAVDALRELLAGGSVKPDEIAEIVCDVPPIVLHNLIYDLPESRQQAQFSMPFALACVWRLGDVTLDMLCDEVIQRADLRACMQCVRQHSSARWDIALQDSAPEGAWLEVRCHDGRRLERFCGMPLGSAVRPMSQAQLREKFIQCSDGLMTSAETQRALDELEQLEQVPQIRALLHHATREQSDL